VVRLAIRPFRLGDVFLLQQLNRYATQLHIEKSLLQHQSCMWDALRTALPWGSSPGMTYVLRQEENGLARAGLLQLEVRPERPEADVVLLTPALDAPQGHPAIWQKLLSQSVQELVDRQINRLYSDLPDQPLVVNTFKQAGFQLYARETIWRLATLPHNWPLSSPSPVRLQRPEDNWNLTRLYSRITPLSVQQAEGVVVLDVKEYADNLNSPILVDDLGLPRSQFVLDGSDGLDGFVQLIWGRLGTWIRLWADTNNPDTEAIHLLLRHALSEIAQDQNIHPIYISVREYQSGIESILSDYTFAPFTDRARMVRHIWQWAYRPVAVRVPSLESVRDVVPGSLVIPKVVGDEPESGIAAAVEEAQPPFGSVLTEN
jgi:hypothetical protein